jgi:ABC-type uncharacterized transport system permease subunit
MALFLLRLTLVLYALASLAAFAALLHRRGAWERLLPVLIATGCAAHLGALIARGAETSRCPLHTSGEVVSFLSLAGVLIFLLGFYRRGQRALAIVLLPLGLVLAFVSNLLPAETLPVAGSGLDRLLILHVAVSTLGAAALLMTFAGSVLYLWQERTLKRKEGASLLRLRLPALETCDKLAYGALVPGFLLMTAGIVTGALWNASSPARAFWIWEQRETLALVAWAIFASLICARLVAGWRGRKAAYLGLVGVAVLLLRMVGLTP